MGQTSGLDKEKSSVLVLPDATAKETDDIAKVCVSVERGRHTIAATEVQASAHCWATFFKRYSKKGRGQKERGKAMITECTARMREEEKNKMKREG